MSLSSEEINDIATKFAKLKKKAEKSRSKKVKREFARFQNFAMSKLTPLVLVKSNRYKQFTNYSDLTQDGFEALLSALDTYNPAKGDFAWWARKYIDTKISRAANTHSTIRVPLKKAKDHLPYKTNVMPVLIDENGSPLENAENVQISEAVLNAINLLPKKQKKLILLAYNFSGKSDESISWVCKKMSISRHTYIRLLTEAQDSLKEKLRDFS